MLTIFGSLGSSNFTKPGLTENIELNVQIQSARKVAQLQEWFDIHWERAVEVTYTVIDTIERHTREYTPYDTHAKRCTVRQRVTNGDWKGGPGYIWTYSDMLVNSVLKRLTKN